MEKGFKSKVPFIIVFLVLFQRQFFYFAKIQTFVVSSNVSSSLLLLGTVIVGIFLLVSVMYYVPLWFVFEYEFGFTCNIDAIKTPYTVQLYRQREYLFYKKIH